MGNRGQATILIAIIFQILFIFFAMVVNVGLLVHDKINLQNSVDIAAYYGAMKQAEVLNAMAHTNYEIRQAYKLFVWRLWVLGDAGRNENFQTGTLGSAPDTAAYLGTTHDYPIVCVQNPFWIEIIKLANKGKFESLCKNPDFSITPITPLNLQGFQLLPIFSSILGTFALQSANNAAVYDSAFKNAGPQNYQIAALIMGSYKAAVAQRRNAMRHLQNLLIKQQSDFSDLSGSSVSTIVKTTLVKNLTAANRNSLDTFSFVNGLANQPFLVPIDLRSMVRYEDNVNSGTTSGQVRNMNDAPWSGSSAANTEIYKMGEDFWAQDFGTGLGPETAAAFAQEPDDYKSNQYALRSLVGFEKNPWVLGYVSVTATTHPKMLFSPFSSTSGNSITLTAESYAMPFGGKMGAWYGTQWGASDASSNGDQVDIKLPPRIGSASDDGNYSKMAPPNYSRFPGDRAGLSSSLARADGVSAFLQTPAAPPSFSQDIGSLSIDPSQLVDPLAGNTSLPSGKGKSPSSRIRSIEMAAVAPDLFDAFYFSVNYDIFNRFEGPARNNWFGSFGDTSMCQGGCLDLGNLVGAGAGGLGVADQIAFIKGSNVPGLSSPPAPVYNSTYWNIRSPSHLNTSWSQGDPGQYGAEEAAKTVGQDWAYSPDGMTPQGGRSGYSVKIVSKKFLNSSLPLGGGAGSGSILNRPQ